MGIDIPSSLLATFLGLSRTERKSKVFDWYGDDSGDQPVPIWIVVEGRKKEKKAGTVPGHSYAFPGTDYTMRFPGYTGLEDVEFIFRYLEDGGLDTSGIHLREVPYSELPLDKRGEVAQAYWRGNFIGVGSDYKGESVSLPRKTALTLHEHFERCNPYVSEQKIQRMVEHWLRTKPNKTAFDMLVLKEARDITRDVASETVH